MPLFVGLVDRNDVDCGVADLGEESIDDRASPENVPASPSRFAEYHMRDAVVASVTEQGVGDVASFQTYNFCSQSLREFDVFLQSGISLGRFDIYRAPIIGRQASCDPCSGPENLLRTASRSYANHHFFRNDGVIEAFAFAIFGVLDRLLLCDVAKCEFAQRREVSLAKKIAESLFDLLNRVNFSLP